MEDDWWGIADIQKSVFNLCLHPGRGKWQSKRWTAKITNRDQFPHSYKQYKTESRANMDLWTHQMWFQQPRRSKHALWWCFSIKPWFLELLLHFTQMPNCLLECRCTVYMYRKVSKFSFSPSSPNGGKKMMFFLLCSWNCLSGSGEKHENVKI